MTNNKGFQESNNKSLQSRVGFAVAERDFFWRFWGGFEREEEERRDGRDWAHIFKPNWSKIRRRFSTKPQVASTI